jgi:acetyltransferase-like isoleucine patch superfamily enzyme
MIINPNLVKLGPHCKMHKNALVGYTPTRTGANLELIIQDNAIVRSGSVIYLGSTIGRHFETGHNVILREENILGSHVKIWTNSVIDYGCKIGDNVKVHCNCYIAQLTTVEDDVFIAPGVMIANEKYPTGIFNPKRIEGSAIKQGAKIGMGSIIMPGITVGEKSLVGAGSLVTKDVPAKTVAYGSPARTVKSVDKLKEYA